MHVEIQCLHNITPTSVCTYMLVAYPLLTDLRVELGQERLSLDVKSKGTSSVSWKVCCINDPLHMLEPLWLPIQGIRHSMTALVIHHNLRKCWPMHVDCFKQCPRRLGISHHNKANAVAAVKAVHEEQPSCKLTMSVLLFVACSAYLLRTIISCIPALKQMSYTMLGFPSNMPTSRRPIDILLTSADLCTLAGQESNAQYRRRAVPH